MTWKICASVTARTSDRLVDMVVESERQGADLIEVRLDFLREAPDLPRIRRLTSLPLIATNRSQREGGLFPGSDELRLHALFAAASEGFEYVDLEVATPTIEAVAVKLREASPVTLILSHHDFQATPSLERLHRIFQDEQAAGADVCKIVSTARTAEDNLTCLHFTSQACQRKDVICFCMGKAGIPSRLFSPLLGGFMTYASVAQGMEAASGQLTIEDTRRFYELLT
jgi:3-dehydroquinate dehydratase type I